MYSCGCFRLDFRDERASVDLCAAEEEAEEEASFLRLEEVTDADGADVDGDGDVNAEGALALVDPALPDPAGTELPEAWPLEDRFSVV